MKFLVIEIQKDKEERISNLVTSHDTINEAESKYHSILAAAAISGLPSHAAVIMEENGNPIAHECYVVEPEPAPEPEPTPEPEEAVNES